MGHYHNRHDQSVANIEVVGQTKKTATDIGAPVIFAIICSFIFFGGIIFFTDNYFLVKVEKENFAIREEIRLLKEQIIYLQTQLEERNLIAPVAPVQPQPAPAP